MIFNIATFLHLKNTNGRAELSSALPYLCHQKAVSCVDYLYRNRLMDIFGVFSKGTSITSTLAIWL